MGIFVDNPKRLKDVIEDDREEGKKIILNGGTYDLLGVGHIDFLERAKKYGDILIVNLTTDERVREYKYKGANGPVNQQNKRAKVISSLECVDYTIIFPYDHPGASIELASFLSPNIDVIVRESSHWTPEIKKAVKKRFNYDISLRSIRPKEELEEERTSNKLLQIGLIYLDQIGYDEKSLYGEKFITAN